MSGCGKGKPFAAYRTIIGNRSNCLYYNFFLLFSFWEINFYKEIWKFRIFVHAQLSYITVTGTFILTFVRAIFLKLLALLFLCDDIVNNHEISYTSAGITKFSKVGLLKHESEINLKWSMSSYSSPSFCTCYAYSTVGQYTPSRVPPVPEPLWTGEQNKIHPDGFNRTISVLLRDRNSDLFISW